MTYQQEVFDLINLVMIAYLLYLTIQNPRSGTTPTSEIPTEPRAEDPQTPEAHQTPVAPETPHTHPATPLADTVANLIERAMGPVVKFHDTFRRDEDRKAAAVRADQHALLSRQQLFERTTERKLAQLQASQKALENRRDDEEERARTVAHKVLIASHQREIEGLNRKIQTEKHRRQKAESKSRDLENEWMKAKDETECLRAEVSKERLRLEEADNHVEAEKKTASNRDAAIAESMMRSKPSETPPPEPAKGLPDAVANHKISRHAVETFKLHPTPKTPCSMDSEHEIIDNLVKILTRCCITELKEESDDMKEPEGREKPAVCEKEPDELKKTSVCDVEADGRQGVAVCEIEPIRLGPPFIFKPSGQLRGSWMAQAPKFAPKGDIFDVESPTGHTPDTQIGGGEVDTEMPPAPEERSVLSMVRGASPTGKGEIDIEMPSGTKSTTVAERVRPYTHAKGSTTPETVHELPEDDREKKDDKWDVMLVSDTLIAETAAELETNDTLRAEMEQHESGSEEMDLVESDSDGDPDQTIRNSSNNEEPQSGATHIKAGNSQDDGPEWGPHQPDPTNASGSMLQAGQAGNVVKQLQGPPNRPVLKKPIGKAHLYSKEQIDKMRALDAASVSACGPHGGFAIDFASAFGSGETYASRQGGNTVTFSGIIDRPILKKPVGKAQKYSKEEIQTMKALDTMPGTHFSSTYLAQLRAHMVSVEFLRALMGDANEDDSFVEQLSEVNQGLGERAFVDMSEETRHAVAPYTACMIHDMMREFFEEYVWKTVDKAFELGLWEFEGYSQGYVDLVKQYMDGHPADVLPPTVNPHLLSVPPA